MQEKCENCDIFCIFVVTAILPEQLNTIIMIYYELESSEERKARRNKGIKTLFQQLVIAEGMPCMEAYEAVGYQFYLSAVQIRAILSSMNKK